MRFHVHTATYSNENAALDAAIRHEARGPYQASVRRRRGQHCVVDVWIKIDSNPLARE